MKKIIITLLIFTASIMAQSRSVNLLLFPSTGNTDTTFSIDMEQILVNGTFEDSSGWSFSSPGVWLIEDGVASANTTSYSYLQRSVNGTVGKNLLFIYELKSYVFGNLITPSACFTGINSLSKVPGYHFLPLVYETDDNFIIAGQGGGTGWSGSVDNLKLYKNFWSAGNVAVGNTNSKTWTITESNSGWSASLETGINFSIITTSTSLEATFEPTTTGALEDSIKILIPNNVVDMPDSFYIPLDGTGI